MTAPLVLLAVDDRIAVALQAALLARGTVTVSSCPRTGLVERVTTGTHVDIVILDAGDDPTAGSGLLSELQAFRAMPAAIVVFASAEDARRGNLSIPNAWEFILGPGAIDGDDASVLSPLLALVDRLIVSEARGQLLGAQAQQFRALVEASSDGVYILRDGRLTWANRRFQDMVGFTEAELTQPGFSMDAITAPESRAFVAERGRRVEAGLVVPPRYEFVAQRKADAQGQAQHFDAHVSVAYIDLGDGTAGALGIMQDITERKHFEQQLLQKNRELQLLNSLAASVGQTVVLDEMLQKAAAHIQTMTSATAVGIALVHQDRRSLRLAAAVGLPPSIERTLAEVVLESPTALSRALKANEVYVVDDIAGDDRIGLEAAREAGFEAAVVVPLKSRSGSGQKRTSLPQPATPENDVVGVAFAFLPVGRRAKATDRDLMTAIGNVLGSAIEKAALLDAERQAVKKLVALDDIALALASTLNADDVALTVARAIHQLFGATRVMVARLASDDDGERYFMPVHVLDDGEPVVAAPIALDETVLGLCLTEKRPVQRVRPREQGQPGIDPYNGKPVDVDAYEAEMFRQGVGTVVAVPVVIDGTATGALWVGYASTTPLGESDLQVLSAIGTHVAIATQNANLFDGRRQALEGLQAAQEKLVASEKVNAIGLIAHGVAHDFNNVLGSILGRAQLLKAQLTDPASLKHAELIEKAARDGAETVRRIHEIGRQDRVDDFTAVDIGEVLTDVMEFTRARWSAKRVEFVVDDAQGLQVAGNPAELREVLVNLVHNAVDATPPSPVRPPLIHLGAEGVAGRVVVRVSDNGTGIPAEMLSRIFDPYFTTKGERGTGLGLSVSASIVRRHGGEMRVTSRTVADGDSGTTFEIELPAVFAEPAQSALAASTATSGAPGRARILVVDDEENIREILAEMLESSDHDVVTAQDGAEALHKLQSDPAIDLVFTDLGLPGMSGFEVAQEMKRLRPWLLVGLVTGWGATLDGDAVKAKGIDRVISKPFRFDEVLGLVDEALLQRNDRHAHPTSTLPPAAIEGHLKETP